MSLTLTVTLWSFPPFLIVPGNHSSTFCLTWVCLFWMFYIKGITQIWPLWLTSFTYSVFGFIQVVAMLVLHSFYNRIIFHCMNMPEFVYTFCFLINICIFFQVWGNHKLSWQVFFGCMFYFLLGKNLGELLSQGIEIYLTSWETAKLFSQTGFANFISHH